MLRICDICGEVDELPRHVVACAPGEAPPPNQALIQSILAREDLDSETKSAVVADLADTTLMLRHLDTCIPFGFGSEH